MKLLSEQGTVFVTLEQDARSIDYRHLDLPTGRDVCVVLGNEIGGVSRLLIDTAQYVVELPMRGIKKSLNVATSGGILMYKVLEICEAKESVVE